ncbi:MAG: hypothetical protein ABIO40_03965 [Devosia sp.]
MERIAAIVLATTLALPAGIALASDAPLLEDIPGVVVDAGGDSRLDGLYATIYGVYVYGNGGGVTASTGIGATFGGSAIVDSFIYGGALSVTAFLSGQLDGEFAAQAVARAGVVVTEGVALSGLLGLGYETYNNNPYVATGLSLDVALSDNVSLRAQYQANYVTPSGAPADPLWIHSLSGALVVGF